MNLFLHTAKPHTDCQSLGLQEITAGTNTLDNECRPRNSPVSIVLVTVLVLVSVVILTVILTVIFILKRRRNSMTIDPAEGERMTRTGQPQDEVSIR
uniref:Uncharacterized protein n=1 Tax=Anguilla anguilla TaxID=7936 RepID=A0A0E9Y122_ANGAN